MLNARKVASAIATGTLLLNAFATTAFASTDLIISDNGANSNSSVNLTQNSSTNVVQSNDAHVNNSVNSSASTGNNSASFNNGGSVKVDTGNATTNTTVQTSANVNKADIANCNCNQDTNVTISNNAAYSNNTANLTNNSSVNAYQDNHAKIDNDVYSTSKTGGNSADFNNGGSVMVKTGDATTDTSVLNEANANLLKIGGSGHGSGAGLSVRILGNAAFSNNTVDLDAHPSVLVSQDNNAHIDNDVDSSAKTGNNSADFNNGGSWGNGVTIDTGDASTTTMVDNMVNFNAADVDCGCLLDTLAKVAGNAYGSNNKIDADLGSSLGIFQDNCGQGHGVWELGRKRNKCGIDNDVNSKAKTGDNDAGFNNAGSQGGDPSINTGDATEDTNVSNQSNMNVVGPTGTSIDLPGDTTINLNLDLGALLALLHLV